MRTALAFIYASLGALTLSILIELAGILPMFLGLFSEGVRVLLASTVIWTGFVLAWIRMASTDVEGT